MTGMRMALIAAFFIYGIPLWRMRYRWRSTVYRTTHWTINVLPWFGHDVAALFTNRYFVTDDERRMARRFRLYLVGYAGLGAAVVYVP
jgi:hypothetical protein